MKKNHKVITCASYGGTGSSVVTDLLKEFNNMNSLGDYEFSIVHDVDGISDLQHNIVDDFHRMKVDEAIYRFKKLIRNLSKGYNPFFNNKFTSISEEYINELIDASWDGFWLQHFNRYGNFQRKLIYGLPRRLQELKYKLLAKKSEYEYVPHYKRSPMYFSFARERFFEVTRNYMEKLFDVIDEDYTNEYLVLDQLIPPSNTERYLKYFNDLKVIIVDRDPRDLYLLNKMFWNEGWIPSHDVEVFARWYRLNREHLKYENDDPNRVLRVRFEDFIFKYDETLAKLMEFIGVNQSNHIEKFKYFNPNVSIKNCRLWKKFNEHADDVKYIEENLSEFCYTNEG